MENFSSDHRDDINDTTAIRYPSELEGLSYLCESGTSCPKGKAAWQLLSRKPQDIQDRTNNGCTNLSGDIKLSERNIQDEGLY